VKERLYTILKYFLIVIFIHYYAGSVAFTHVHHFATYTIVHSHPYLPGADGNPHHTHSTAEYLTIMQLNTMTMLEGALPFLAIAAVLLLAVFLLFTPIIHQTRSIRVISLRAPPFFE